MGIPKISVVVPVYQERNSIRPFLDRLGPVLGKIGAYEILFVADPSPDGTDQNIEEEIKYNPKIGLIVMSRRFGQPAATLAGILHASGETCVVIDVDLQDPPELILEMYEKLNEGYDVVYAKRRSRRGETAFKLWVSGIGYRVINKISDVPIPRDTGDFRIMTRRVIEELRKLKETHGFLRGLVGFVGFRQTFVEYDRDARAHGSGNYNPFTGSLKIALNGLLGFSRAPLAISFVLGLFIKALSLIPLIAAVVFWITGSYAAWPAFLIFLILFLGGVQLVSVGILGGYIGRIYDEVKGRPAFIIDRSVNVKNTVQPYA